jgi:hypothetical protein
MVYEFHRKWVNYSVCENHLFFFSSIAFKPILKMRSVIASQLSVPWTNYANAVTRKIVVETLVQS